MTAQTSAPSVPSAAKALLQQIGLLLTGPNRNAAAGASSRQQPQSAGVLAAVPPFSPPPVFIDYAAEGDEPADLALIELIPPGLQALNLPHCLPQASKPPAGNACALTTRPLTEQEITAAELAELIPLDLSRLDRTFGPLAHQPDSVLLPNLASLKRTAKETCLSANDETAHRIA